MPLSRQAQSKGVVAALRSETRIQKASKKTFRTCTHRRSHHPPATVPRYRHRAAHPRAARARAYHSTANNNQQPHDLPILSSRRTRQDCLPTPCSTLSPVPIPIPISRPPPLAPTSYPTSPPAHPPTHRPPPIHPRATHRPHLSPPGTCTHPSTSRATRRVLARP